MSSRLALPRARAATVATLPTALVIGLVIGLLTALLTTLLAPGVADARPGKKRPPVPDQHTTISVLPPISHMGPTPQGSRRAKTVISATFHPAREGRPVVLTRWHNRRWQPVERTELTRTGLVEFSARSRAAGQPVRYRVTALPYHRLAKISTDPVRSDAWGAPDFVDEFGGAALGARWEHRIQFYNPWGGRSCSKGSAQAVGVQAGALQLSAMADPEATEPCYTYDEHGTPLGTTPHAYRINGHVSTQQSADFLYGVAAARMRFHATRGSHASFWLQPRGLLPYGTTPWGAEIDVVEWYGADERRGGLTSTVYRPTATGAKEQIGGRFPDTDSFLASRSDRWWRNYHVFSVEWTPTEYVFRIDGRETWRTSEGISHHPQFLILSQLSSDYELAANPTGSRQTTSVDWVQFWQAG